jgi:tRNA (cytidine/uridine-2'-O-)-methyltransferase
MTTPLYEPCLHVVLYQPEIPPNTGNVGRTCVAVGAKLWLVRPLGFQLDDYYLRRAGLDYWPFLNWEAVDDWATLCARLDGKRFWAFSKFANRAYHEARYQRDDVLIFGSESSGLPEEIRESLAENLLLVPMRKEVRSLNLANTVAIALYEAQRQGITPPG